LLTIQAKDDLKQVMLMANVPDGQPARPPMSPLWAVLGGLLIIGLVIAAIIVFVVLGTSKRSRK
jgi:hypothetical protein